MKRGEYFHSKLKSESDITIIESRGSACRPSCFVFIDASGWLAIAICISSRVFDVIPRTEAWNDISSRDRRWKKMEFQMRVCSRAIAKSPHVAALA